MRRWRTDQHKIEALIEPWYIAKAALAALQAQAQEIQANHLARAVKAQNPKEDQTQIQLQIQALRGQLMALAPQIARAKRDGCDRVPSQIASSGASPACRTNRRFNGDMGSFVRRSRAARPHGTSQIAAVVQSDDGGRASTVAALLGPWRSLDAPRSIHASDGRSTASRKQDAAVRFES